MKDNTSSYNSSVYDAKISNVLPYYAEFHSQVIDVAKMVFNEKEGSFKWLDTGCGTGTLALRALGELPNTEFTLCDPSEGMLEIAKEKLRGRDICFNIVPSHELPCQLPTT